MSRTADVIRLSVSNVDVIDGHAPHGSRQAVPTARAGFTRLVGASAWLLSANMVALGFGVLQLIVLARVLGPNSYGLLALMATYTATMNQLVDSRSWETATTFLIRYRAAGDLFRAAALAKFCYVVDAITAVVALGIIVATSEAAARVFLKDASMAPLIAVCGLPIVLNAAVGTSLTLSRVAGRFHWVALYNASSAAIRLLAVLVALATVGTLRSVVWAQVFAAVATGAAAVWLGMRGARSLNLEHVHRASLSSLRRDLGGILRFLATTNASALLKMVQRHADVLLVGYFLTPIDAGFVRLAKSFSDLMNIPVAPMYEASFPAFSSLWQQGARSELRALAKRVTAMGALVGGAGLVVLGVAATPLTVLAAGPAYEPAGGLVRLLAVGMAIAVATSAWHPLLVTVAGPGRSLVALTAGVAIQSLVLFVALPTFGVAAVGFAFIGFYLAWTLVVGWALSTVLSHG